MINPLRVNLTARIVGLLLLTTLWTSIISNDLTSKLACSDVATFINLTMEGQELATPTVIHDSGLRGQAIAYFWGSLILMVITHLWVVTNRGRIWSKSLALSLLISGELFLVTMAIRFAMNSSFQWHGGATLILPGMFILPVFLSVALATGWGFWILTGKMVMVVRRPPEPPPGPDMLRLYRPCVN